MIKSIIALGLGLVLVGCVPPPTPQEITLTAKGEALRNLTVCVQLSEGDGSQRELVQRVQASVRESLTGAGLRVVEKSKDAVLAVSGHAVISDVTQRGSRTVCRGSVQLKLCRLGGERDIGNPLPAEILSECTLDSKGDEGYSDSEALTELAKSFTPQLQKWAKDAAMRAAEEIKVCAITFNASASKDKAKVAAIPTRFAQQALKIAGVYDCRVRSVKTKTTEELQYVATIVYDQRAIPEGVLNRMRALEILK